MRTCRREHSLVLFLSLILLLQTVPGHAVSWFPFGPDGGDARSLAVDPQNPKHVYLGTLTGWIYESFDEGAHWKRLAQLSRQDDLVLDNMLVDPTDPKRLFVGAYVLDRQDGGFFTSTDGGHTWHSSPGMKGQSIRSLAEAPSEPKTLVAGTLTGVYRTDDLGATWRLISPAGSKEIHEVESVAVDPKNPDVIYAGTWHLPWKTINGGKSWESIKQGVIDDSDVFSIIVDPVDPKTVYASACSGIYKSDNAGLRFQKVEGIPSSARRTRVLTQDPSNRNVVFAGTTEGLWRTGDAGKIWIRMTSADVIVNDVYIDPHNSQRLLVATDRGGVLASDDGGASFYPSNKGFASRQITSYVADRNRPADVYIGLLNDKQWGGVYFSPDGGISWIQKAAGLDGSDVFSLGQAPDGTILAGTRHGIYRLQNSVWGRVDNLTVTHESPARRSRRAPVRRAVRRTARRGEKEPLDAAVYAFATNGNTVFAASSTGLLSSLDSGLTWHTVGVPEPDGVYFLGSSRGDILVGGAHTMSLSTDSGLRWKSVAPPSQLIGGLAAVAVDDTGTLWAGGREGVFFSTDRGASWQTIPGLDVGGANSLYFDPHSERVLITSSGTGTIAFGVHVPDHRLSFWNTGWNLRFLRPIGDHLIAATVFDGIVLEPRMVDSPIKTGN